MDILFLYFLGFAILAVTSWVTSLKYFKAAGAESRFRGTLRERGLAWRTRALWFGALALCAALAKLAGVLGLPHPTAHYTLLLLTFGLWAGSARLVLCLYEDKPGLWAVVGTILLIATCVVIVSPLLAILSGMFFDILFFPHIVVGLAGLYVGLRPAIQRWRFNKALERAKGGR